MKRNLESRVEVLVPVEDAIGRQRLRAMLDLQLTPNRNAWLMQSDGSYVRAIPEDKDTPGSQQAFMEWLLHEQPSRPAARRRRQTARYARRPAS